MYNSAEEALKNKETYYKSYRSCPLHNIKTYWAHNRLCMACVGYDGKPHKTGYTPTKDEPILSFGLSEKQQLKFDELYHIKGLPKSAALRMAKQC